MAVTIEQLLEEVEALRVARDDAAEAHDATVASKDNVVNVTNLEQAKIDGAVAHFDIATREAAQSASDAEAAEVIANDEENLRFATLLEDLQKFKDGQ